MGGDDRLPVDPEPSTLSLNIPDFTRFGADRRTQVWGRTLGLPTTMTLIALLSVFVTSGSQAVYGAPTRDPVELAARTGNVFGLLLAPVTVLVATVSMNIAANVVSRPTTWRTWRRASSASAPAP